MKKIAYLLLILLATIAIVGCGGGGGGGGGGGDPVSTIHFTMPGTYQIIGSEGGSNPIPSGKTVKIYSVQAFGEGIISIDHVFAPGVTGSATIERELPPSLLGEERYFAAVVVLGDDFDLQGKTQAQVLSAVSSGQILFGQTRDSGGNNKAYELYDGITISDFVFFGSEAPDESGTISFIIPETYQIIGSEGSTNPISTGKTIKIYSVQAFGEGTISIDHAFAPGVTGSAVIKRELPPSLLGEERYFAAVVVLGDDFDLQGKTQDQVWSAVYSGQILFGQTRDSSGNNIAYELYEGISIEDFIMYGNYFLQSYSPGK